MASAARRPILCLIHLLLFWETTVLSYQYKVGDLDAWGIPTSANSLIYVNWSKKHQFLIGDSLLFLYPPSQDSVIQVTSEAFNSCNISDPVLKMEDGNSVFNITSPGVYYFTSGESGHCQKKQKLQISVLSSNGSGLSPSYGPAMLPATATAPSFANAFGTIPTASAALGRVPESVVFVSVAMAFLCYS